MPDSIPVDNLSRLLDQVTLIDVRKEPARKASGSQITGSLYQKPFDAENWWQDHSGHTVVVYCVHGHEVSQAVCGFLCDKGVTARYLEGGFEAWQAAGLSVSSLADSSAGEV